MEYLCDYLKIDEIDIKAIDKIKQTLDVSDELQSILNEIDKLNKDPKIDGILVQSPVPKHIDYKKVVVMRQLIIPFFVWEKGRGTIL